MPPVIALIWIGTLMAAAEFGATSSIVPLLALAAVVPAFILFKAAQGRPYAIATVLVLVLLLIDSKFETPRVNFEFSWQAAMKAVVWMILIGLAGMRWYRISRILIRPEIILLLGYLTIALASASWSLVPAFSGGAALGHFAYAALACMVVVDLREETVIRLIVWTLLAFICSGLIAAVVAPDLAWLPASLDEWGSGDRLQGLAAHPNSLGQISAILMLMVSTAKKQALIGRTAFYACLAFGVLTILEAGSRTALVSALTAWGLVAARNSRFGGAIVIAALGTLTFVVILAACEALPDLKGILSSLSRSGRESEILTLTGRTEIWDIAWAKIMQKPFFGWGYYGTEQLIADSMDSIFSDQAKHAHNMLLQSLLSVGFLGTAPGFAYMILLVGRFVTHPDPTRDKIALFVLVLGFSEPSAFGLPVASETFVFYWVLAREAAKRIPAAGLSFEPAINGVARLSAGHALECPRRS
jgi:O-antigen ligase